MRRRNFLKAIAALAVSPALLLKKRKREADRSVKAVQSDGYGGWSVNVSEICFVNCRFISRGEAVRLYGLHPEFLKKV